MCKFEKLKREQAENLHLIDSLISIMNTDVGDSQGEITKKVIHTSKDVVVHFSTLEPNAIREIKDQPFDSEVILVDGAMELRYGNDFKFLDKNNRTAKIAKGSDAKGKAILNTAVITVIDINS